MAEPALVSVRVILLTVGAWLVSGAGSTDAGNTSITSEVAAIPFNIPVAAIGVTSNRMALPASALTRV